MIKRTIFFFMTVFLCGVISFAQNKRAEYEKLVDYVNCYYAEKYISNKISEIKKEEDKKAFEKYKKVFKNSVKTYSDISIGIDSAVPNSTTIYNALKKFASYNTKSMKLWQFIDNKKDEYNDNWNKVEMIDYLVLLTDDMMISSQRINYKTYLKNSTIKLKKNLEDQISDNLFTSNTHNQIDIQDGVDARNSKSANNSQIDNQGSTCSESQSDKQDNYSSEKEYTNRRKGSTSKFPWVWLFFLCIIGIGFWQRKRLIPLFSSGIDLIKKQINNKDGENVERLNNSHINTENSTQEIIKLNKEISELKRVNMKLQNREITIDQLKEVVKKQIQTNPDFRRFVISLLKDNNSSNSSEIIKGSQSFIRDEKNISKEKEVIKENISVLYADSIIDGYFNQVKEIPDEDTIFELYIQNEQTASFTISSIAFPRIIARPSFLDGCDKQVLNNAQNVEIINKGTVQKQTDGKWKIINKLNVIIN